MVSVLPTIETEKDLGVNVMNNLKWDFHISQNISKAKKCIGWVKRNVISREKCVMLNIYKSLIRPHLEYCVSALESCSKTWQLGYCDGAGGRTTAVHTTHRWDWFIAL